MSRLFYVLICICLPVLLNASQYPLKKHGNQPSDLLSLHRGLVEIESITGNEYAVGQYLVDYLHQQNYTVQKQEVAEAKEEPSRFNILAYPPGSKSHQPRVLLTSHIDTVPPFIEYERKGEDEIWGRVSSFIYTPRMHAVLIVRYRDRPMPKGQSPAR